MDAQWKERWTKRLNDMLLDLEGEAHQTIDGMREGAGQFPDPTDRATLETDRNLTLRIRDRERKLRDKVEEALARVQDGTFGLCETCGDPINETRLEARPVTTLCINCKTAQEEAESRHNK
ncbi:MAG: RNA polymerase-binding protein DksA [Deltaproteobacteria bacterium]|nr:RNA polymerase-binding protein DksA [Deltaproteobacteria bacterium]